MPERCSHVFTVNLFGLLLGPCLCPAPCVPYWYLHMCVCITPGWAEPRPFIPPPPCLVDLPVKSRSLPQVRCQFVEKPNQLHSILCLDFRFLKAFVFDREPF